MAALYSYCLARQAPNRKLSFHMFQINKALVLKEGSLQYPEHTDIKKDIYSP